MPGVLKHLKKQDTRLKNEIGMSFGSNFRRRSFVTKEGLTPLRVPKGSIEFNLHDVPKWQVSQRGKGAQHRGALLLKSSQKFLEIIRGFQIRISSSERSEIC